MKKVFRPINNNSLSVFGLKFSFAGQYSLLISVIGIIIYALLSFQIIVTSEYSVYGINIYDQYYQGILRGDLTLKATVLQYEGHYLPDGTGYLYHGIAPLITRVVFGWLIDFQSSSLAPFSIWLWATVGTLFYHLTFYQIIIKFWPENANNKGWAIMLSLLCWFATPGILIAANVAFYHEVIAIAYAATAIFVYVFSRYQFFNLSLSKTVILLSLLAAIVVHARPNLAIGLYVGVVLLCCLCVLKFNKKTFFAGSLAMIILGSSGLGYLGVNSLKFGDYTVTHGSFEDHEVQYGSTFWIGETPEISTRARAFVDYGRFNLKRVLPNAVFYTFDPPFYVVGHAMSEQIGTAYNAAIKPLFGYIRLEGPRVGMLFLWMGWIGIIIFGFMKLTSWRNFKGSLILLIATGAAFIITLSYGTMTLRYRFDMWPFFATLIIVALPYASKHILLFTEGWRRALVVLLFGISLTVTLRTAHAYTYHYREIPGSYFEPWTEEFCKNQAKLKGLNEIRAKAICET